MDAKVQTVVRATLSTGKVVLLREMKISDAENAAKEVSKRAAGDQTLLQIYSQKVLVRNLIVQIDGRKPTQADKEDMDSLFSIQEYGQIISVIQKMQGGDDMGEAQIEVVNTGSASPTSVDTLP